MLFIIEAQYSTSSFREKGTANEREKNGTSRGIKKECTGIWPRRARDGPHTAPGRWACELRSRAGQRERMEWIKQKKKKKGRKPVGRSTSFRALPQSRRSCENGTVIPVPVGRAQGWLRLPNAHAPARPNPPCRLPSQQPRSRVTPRLYFWHPPDDSPGSTTVRAQISPPLLPR